jgi:hypothetical protein
MQLRHSFRVVTAAALIASLGLVGCGRANLVAPTAMEDASFDALSKPVNVPATAAAKAWQADATQVATMCNRSPRGVQDQATYVFSSNRDKDHLLLVIASNGGLQSRLINMSDRAADGLRGLLPLTQKQVQLLNSKNIFKQAEHLGLTGAQDAIIMNGRSDQGVMPIALVLDGEGKRYMAINAVTGEPLTGVQTAGVRHVQFHLLIIAAVVVVGAAVAFGVYEWRKHHDPKPQPSGNVPTPPPAPSAAPTTVPTSHPATDIGRILAGPFGDMFDRLDADKDGSLTLAEYLRPAPDGTTIKVKTDEFQQFIDPRKAGKVTRAQFLAGIEKSVQNKAAMSFSMLDQNQDSGLDAQELSGDLQPHEISDADTNHDGKLSQAEYSVPFATHEGVFAAYYK